MFSYLKSFIQTTQEIYLPAKDIIHNLAFNQLGLTDVGLLELNKRKDNVLITTDLSLYVFAIGQGLQAINFNHIRNSAYQ